ncbi:hypothetical protein MHZ93_03840 [Roseomonas sp. ACRSG]|nr:hypothetical protein [Roseomonas sp. ACRSG]
MQILQSVLALAARLPAMPTAPSGPAALNKALQHTATLAPHDALILLVVDLFAADAGTRAALDRLRRHNELMVIPVSDPLEAELPAPPWRGLADDGSGPALLDPAASNLGQRVRTGVAARLEALCGAGRRHAVPVLPIGTDAEPAAQLRRQMGQRRTATGGGGRAP